jgi:hypothetical protein
LPDALRLANGESAYAKPGGRLYATPDTDRLLQVAAVQDRSLALSSEQARLFVEELTARGAGDAAGADPARVGRVAAGTRPAFRARPAGAALS